MRLSKANIKNFRSISNVIIEFEPTCRILVGINESGKTNILKALSLLEEGVEPSDDDIREILPHETPVTEAFVRFEFVLDKDERIRAYELIVNSVLGNVSEIPVVKQDGKDLTLAQYIDTKKTTLYKVNLLTKKKAWSYWSDKINTVTTKWKKPSKQATSSLQIDDKSVPLKTISLIDVDKVTEYDIADEVEDVSIEYVNEVAGVAINKIVADKLPGCTYWEYKEVNLLPGQIDINSFITSPDSCIPMKHMFALAGFKDVKIAIEEARKRPNGMRNLLKRVSELSTKHMHGVWKDYKGIRLQLVQNGDKIDAHVEDAYNVYNLARRSDGFKRFITFLLLVSAQVKTKDIENTLYLHDEPDVSLHPSGARYLRDELITMSANNYVVYSTHSIFMIDRNTINRHLIVKKKDEVTEIAEVNDTNIVDEEVIYNALGYSIFENLKAKNIIFEGWRDKRLFQYALEKLPVTHKALKHELADIGICHAKGVKDISRISPILELAGRECLILSDGDTVAIEHQSNYEGYGLWVRYDELVVNGSVVTSEDFFKPDAFKSLIKTIMNENPSLPALPLETLENATGRLLVIQRWLVSNGISKDASKSILNTLKDGLISNLRPGHIEPTYYEMLSELAKKLNS